MGKKSTSLSTPPAKVEVVKDEEHVEYLEAAEATRYRALVARGIY